MTRVLLVGVFGPGALENSYFRGFSRAGSEVHTFDVGAAQWRNCRLGPAGRFFNTFVPVEPWIRKANRELILRARELEPDVVLVFGQNRVRVGSLAQLKAIPGLQTALVWQDALSYLDAHIVAALPMYDLVASYAHAAVGPLTRFGASRVEWIPLGADVAEDAAPPDSVSPSDDADADVSFIGQWRPERDAAVSELLAALPNLRIKIWGPDWGRRARRKPAVLAAWQKTSLYGPAFERAVRRSRISLNIIDDTNFPAANMRFFEIPSAGGLQLSSRCPEMERSFKDGETVFYYRDIKHLPDVVTRILSDPPAAARVRVAARRAVLAEHTYEHRASSILACLGQ